MAKAPTSEAGYSGTPTYGGIASVANDERADAWRPPTRWQTIDKMRADPVVNAALAAITFPILAAPLEVHPADPDDRVAVRYADFVRADLEGMTTDLMSHRLETLDCVGDGVAVFETVFERRGDGKFHLRKLPRRPNRTIVEWTPDAHGGPAGVVQLDDQGQRIPLSIDRLLAFTYMRSGASLLGRPVLRSMYRPWFMIDKLVRIGAISAERGAGIPWAQFTGKDERKRSRMEDVLSMLHAHERGYVLTDEDVPKWGFEGPAGKALDPVPQMEYHRRDLLLAPLAQFLALGSDGVGSLALSRDHSELFLLLIQFVAEQIETIYNRYLIPRWIGYNWSADSGRLPRVAHGPIGKRSAKEWLEALQAAVTSGVELPAEQVREAAAAVLGIDIPSDDKLTGAQDVNAGDGASGPGDGGAEVQGAPAEGAGDPAGLGERSRPVELSSRELVSPAVLAAFGVEPEFVEMASDLDDAEARIVRELGALQSKQAKRIAAKLRRIVRERDFEALESFEVEFDEERESLAEAMSALVAAGQRYAEAELAVQGLEDPADVDDEEAAELVGAIAAEHARALADRMRTAAGAAAMAQMLADQNDGDALAAAIAPAGAKLLGDLARQASGAGFGIGRAAVSRANESRIAFEVYSAVMDPATCSGSPERCYENDGLEFPVGRGTRAPNPACLGGWRCRCVRVPIVASDRIDERHEVADQVRIARGITPRPGNPRRSGGRLLAPGESP